MALAGKASVESGGQKPLRVKSGKSRVRMKPGLGVQAICKAYYVIIGVAVLAAQSAQGSKQCPIDSI